MLGFDATATPIVKPFESVLLTPDLAMETKALVRYQDLVNQLQLYNAVNAGQLFDSIWPYIVLCAVMLAVSVGACHVVSVSRVLTTCKCHRVQLKFC